HPSEIFNEHVALTAFKNDPNQSESKNNQPRYLNLAKDLPMPVLSRADYEVMPPFQWGGARITSTQVNLIAITPSDIASLPNFHHFHPHQRRQKTNKSDVKNRDKWHNTDFNPSTVNLRLITGRIRDQWHTMTRTGLAPQLNQHESVPTLTIHPHEAKQLGVEKGDYVQLRPCYEQILPNSEATTIDTNNFNTDTDTDTDTDNENIEQTVLAQIAISDSMRVGDAFMPMHWSNAFASFARVGTLIPTVVDPYSGQPELKNSAIRMSAVPMQTLGKIMVHPDFQDTILVHLRAMTAHFKKEAIAGESQTASIKFELNGAGSSLSLPALTWSISRQANSVLITLASPAERTARQLLDPKFWQQFIDDYQKSVSDKWLTGNADDTLTVNSAFTLSKPEKQLRFISTQSEVRSEALNHIPSPLDSTMPSDQLLLAIYFAPKVMYLPSTHWLDSCFASTDAIPVQQRYKWLLAGRPATGYIDPGPLVCSCMAVGENIIINAIAKQQCHSAQSVGKACRAGTNCGSCVSQINALIEEHAS
ncbi:(2Fe-2S)-binding protein, partial [Psychrobacter sp. 16-Bac2893]